MLPIIIIMELSKYNAYLSDYHASCARAWKWMFKLFGLVKKSVGKSKDILHFKNEKYTTLVMIIA